MNRSIPSCIPILVSIILILSSCKKDFSIPDNFEIQLAVESAEVTETWLRLRVTPTDTETIFTVKRDTHTVFSGKLIKADTLLNDENLQPAHTYTYKAFLEPAEGEVSANSATTEVTITTMDTTSHNFTWQTWEFGGQTGSSVFYDVAIIDENDIWAVGEIYTTDDHYNAAHWDGEKWELKSILYYDKDKSKYFWSPIKSIFAFSKNNIWFEGGIHWNGTIFESLKKNISFPSHVNKIWGTSDNDLYIVDNGGLIAHYDGQEWSRIESGTDDDIHDIWGAINEKTGTLDILCTASKIFQISEKKLIRIDPNTHQTSEINWPYQNRRLHSIWFNEKNQPWICGAGIFKQQYNGLWKEYDELPLIFTNRIRGTEINDIFACGDFGFLAHFNGQSWKTYDEVSGHAYLSLDYKNDLLVAVGHWNPAGRILMMMRK